MRAIKFRVWDGRTMSAPFCLNQIHSGGLINPDDENLFDIEDEDTVIMQFIGFLDRNDREIYEGDIVRTMYGTTGEVLYYLSEEHKQEFPSGGIGCDAGFIIREGDRSYRNINTIDEVIGNIYEGIDNGKKIKSEEKHQG